MEIVIRITPEELKEILGKKMPDVENNIETIIFDSGEHTKCIDRHQVQKYLNNKAYWEMMMNNDHSISKPIFGTQTRQNKGEQ